jgi:hypothetical protein
VNDNSKGYQDKVSHPLCGWARLSTLASVHLISTRLHCLTPGPGCECPVFFLGLKKGMWPYFCVSSAAVVWCVSQSYLQVAVGGRAFGDDQDSMSS